MYLGSTIHLVYRYPTIHFGVIIDVMSSELGELQLLARECAKQTQVRAVVSCRRGINTAQSI